MEQRCTHWVNCLSHFDRQYMNDLHVYPNIKRLLISWKACRELCIFPDCYPHPITSSYKPSMDQISHDDSVVNSTTEALYLSLDSVKE